MRKILLFVSFLFSIYTIAQNNKINWDESRKLTWNDFQSKPKDNSHGTANTSYKIDIIPNHIETDEHDNIYGYEKLNVVAVFLKNRSWSKQKKENSNLLNHEQLHFDIAELFARKIRQKFNELKAKKEARFSIYQKEYSKLWDQCRRYQKQYDKETIHGVKKKKNDVWRVKVDKELLELIAF